MNKSSKIYGLLYQRDKGTNFPFDEIKRAVECFKQKSKYAGLTPALVHINPEHRKKVEAGQTNLEIVFDENVGLGYIWLRGQRNGSDKNKTATSKTYQNLTKQIPSRGEWSKK